MIFTAVEFNIEQFVNYVANFFSIAECKCLWLDVARSLAAKLF